MSRIILLTLMLLMCACSGADTGMPGSSGVAMAGHRDQATRLPTGIFISSGPRVDDALLALAPVSGNLIRVSWRDIEPRQGHYDFSSIHALIAQARKHNKKVALSVLNGPHAPAWLYENGAVAFEYRFVNRYVAQSGRVERIPVPWDPVYLQAWLATIAALGKEFSQEKTIALVHITASSKNGFEMQLPEQPVMGRRETAARGPWKDAGYREEQYIAVLKQVTDGFMQAFPAHPVDIEIHPVLESVQPARDIYEYGVNRYGQRFGLLAAWWSGIEQPWNGQLGQVLESACQRSFCTVQLIGNQTRQPQRLLDGSALRAIEVAHKLGANYYEVWDIDVRNQPLLDAMAAFLTAHAIPSGQID